MAKTKAGSEILFFNFQAPDFSIIENKERKKFENIRVHLSQYTSARRTILG